MICDALSIRISICFQSFWLQCYSGTIIFFFEELHQQYLTGGNLDGRYVLTLSNKSKSWFEANEACNSTGSGLLLLTNTSVQLRAAAESLLSRQLIDSVWIAAHGDKRWSWTGNVWGGYTLTLRSILSSGQTQVLFVRVKGFISVTCEMSEMQIMLH